MTALLANPGAQGATVCCDDQVTVCINKKKLDEDFEEADGRADPGNNVGAAQKDRVKAALQT